MPFFNSTLLQGRHFKVGFLIATAGIVWSNFDKIKEIILGADHYVVPRVAGQPVFVWTNKVDGTHFNLYTPGALKPDKAAPAGSKLAYVSDDGHIHVTISEATVPPDYRAQINLQKDWLSACVQHVYSPKPESWKVNSVRKTYIVVSCDTEDGAFYRALMVSQSAVFVYEMRYDQSALQSGPLKAKWDQANDVLTCSIRNGPNASIAEIRAKCGG